MHHRKAEVGHFPPVDINSFRYHTAAHRNMCPLVVLTLYGLPFSFQKQPFSDEEPKF